MVVDDEHFDLFRVFHCFLIDPDILSQKHTWITV
jgi:hypothetical protein